LKIIEKVAGISYNKETVANKEKLFKHLLTESANSPSSVFEFINGRIVLEGFNQEELNTIKYSFTI